MQKHSQDLVLLSIKIIEIVPNALLPFWLYFHYAPDAAYLKINPMVQLSIRERHSGQQKQSILFRQVIVSREKSDIIIDNSTENYSVFNAKYYNTKTEVTNHLSLLSDLRSQANLENFN
jgi:hypothetical protein